MDRESAEAALYDLNASRRHEALAFLAAGDVGAPVSRHLLVNLHCHTFFSYNGYGHSPSSLAWLARKSGWYALGTVDFDVLDGVDETLHAAEALGVRACAGLETRAFEPDSADIEFNSPGEPGVMYMVGIGFTSSVPSMDAADALSDMRERSQTRNREMVAGINAFLGTVAVDYDTDVLPLTPSGNVTERHILLAYDAAARARYPERNDLVRFWARALRLSEQAVEAFLTHSPFPHDIVRARLMKRGGPGYAQPGQGAFPPLATVLATIRACGAVPSYPFVDGTSAGEQRITTLLERLIGQGVECLTLVPERNWNLPEGPGRDDKVARLHALLALARRYHVPVLIGTEMNRHGQRLVDDLTVPVLAPYVDDFRRAADWAYGHTLLAKSHRLGYGSMWARAYLPDRTRRVEFYAAVGRTVSPPASARQALPRDTIDAGPAAVLDWYTRRSP